jgi:acetoin utilization deacetylase AcuC-like enzyme
MNTPFQTPLSRGRRLLHQAAGWLGLARRREVPVFYHPAYRLPLAGLEASMGVEPRRADFVIWYLLQSGAISASQLRTPQRVTYADLARVHTASLIDSLGRPETLGSIYAVDPSDVPVDETLNTVRLACGGTLGAAKAALEIRGPSVNLLGGFHHAGPDKIYGMCPVNDIAVSLAALRSEGFSGKAAVIDLDAHPPDGTAACFQGDPQVWIGSLSGSHWAPLLGVDETVLRANCSDGEYLEALLALLTRMPTPSLAFVIAGGDVLAGDSLGKLGLSLDGVRRRDLILAEVLEGFPSVWLPGGGYHRHAWKALAGTVCALTSRSRKPIPEHFDPLSARYAQIWQSFGRERPGEALSFSSEDVEETLHLAANERPLLLGYFTAERLEMMLHHCGILEHLQRLGYSHFRVEVDAASPGDRMRLFGESEGARHPLMEAVLEKRRVAGLDVLYVHWLTLRNPRAQFNDHRPQLPGQEMPGLGLAREAEETLDRMARQLGLQGVVYRPAWYHMAYAARHRFRFIDPRRQGRFEAVLRDLGKVPLREATLAFAQNRVRMNGAPYAWEADEMICWPGEHPEDRRAIEAERARVWFTLIATPASQNIT